MPGRGRGRKRKAQEEKEVVETVTLSLDEPTDVSQETWIVGDSLVGRAEQYAASSQHTRAQLADLNIFWKGMSGMHWDQLLPTIQYLLISRGHPKAIVLHLGGNDIASTVQHELMYAIRRDLEYLSSTFVNTFIVWVDILPRLRWRNNYADSTKNLDMKRKRVNRAARDYISQIPLGKVISPKIDHTMVELFSTDGVHLSQMGNLVYIQTLISGLVNSCN